MDALDAFTTAALLWPLISVHGWMSQNISICINEREMCEDFQGSS